MSLHAACCVDHITVCCVDHVTACCMLCRSYHCMLCRSCHCMLCRSCHCMLCRSCHCTTVNAVVCACVRLHLLLSQLYTEVKVVMRLLLLYRRRSCLLYLLILLLFAALVCLDSELTWTLDSSLYHPSPRQQRATNNAIGQLSPNTPTATSSERERPAHHPTTPVSNTTLYKKNYERIVTENVRVCFKSSNLVVNSSFLATAQHNALSLYREYRTIIPRQFLTNYLSHCWHADYQIGIGRTDDEVRGHIDKLTFTDRLPNDWYAETKLSVLKNRSFSASTVCVPNLYILGVPKCGTTFLWCLINKIQISTDEKNIQISTDANQNSTDEKYGKEPHFWTPYQYLYSVPNATHIASRYLSNFVRQMPLSEEQLKRDVLIDGSPNMVLEWPKFNSHESDLTNYCILPSTMPELMPESKYIIILRNPIEALYSAFWWSLNFISTKDISIVFRRRYRSPNIFHKRILEKIDKFNLCLTDPKHPNVCTLSAGQGNSSYFDCVRGRSHLLSSCVDTITVQREPYQTVLHKTIYYPHLVKWLSVLPSERLLVLTMETLLKHPLETTKKIVKFVKLTNYASLNLNQELIKKTMNSCSFNPQLTIDYKNNKRLKMREDTKTLLQEFFKPFNAMLTELLADTQFTWF